ncbi:MAG: class I SAM-dependent methyltransferase [Candidatus Woesearchaeota archaeon]
MNYNKVAELYYTRRNDKQRFDYNRDIDVPVIIKMVGDVRNKIILDVACGFGDHARILSQKGAKQIIGFDLSQKLIKYAQKSKILRTEFVVGNMDKEFPFKKNTFDVVICSLAIHYTKNLDKLFAQIYRLLKPKGIFVYSTGHPIFNMINSSPKHILGILKDGTKKIINGDYFNESFQKGDLGTLGWMKMRNFTHQTLIQTALKHNFVILDYIDAKPVPHSRKYDSYKFKLTSKLPTFIVFKLKKRE